VLSKDRRVSGLQNQSKENLLSNDFVPLNEEELAAIRELDTPTIANVLEPLDIRARTEGFTRPEIKCVFPDMGTMVGYAVTVTMSASSPGQGVSREEYFEAIAATPAPRVVVIHDRDYPNPIGSYWGEVQGNIAVGLKCVGCVTDGGVRDLKEVEALGFQYFAKEILVSHAYVHPEAVGIPVDVGGMRVEPGDLIVGDMHGVIQVPHDVARKLPELAADAAKRESIMITAAQEPDVTVDSLRAALAKMMAYRPGDIH